MHNTTKRILLLGGSGQVGSSFIKLLQEDENSSHVIFAPDSKSLDVTNSHQLRAVFDDFQPTIVVNAAAYTAVEKAEVEPDLAYAINQDAVAVLSESCASRDVLLLHISTDYIFDGTKADCYSEEDRPNPLSVYGKSKLGGENKIRQFWQKHIILRTSWVFSELKNNFVHKMLQLSSQQDAINVVADQRGNPTSAKGIAGTIYNIIQNVMQCPERNIWGVYNYTGAPSVTWYEFARIIFSEAAAQSVRSPQIFPVLSKDFSSGVIRPLDSRLNLQKINRVFGIQPDDWQKELRLILKGRTN